MAGGDGSRNELAAAPRSGTRLGAYEIGAVLGAGATGAVYEGVRITDGKRVAIKILGRELGAKPTARARFLNEAKLAARVRHPNIVEILDAGEEGEAAYLVMELLQGEDLARRFDRWGAMSVAQAADLLVPVCEAVATAHAAGVTHRDLKPSNIFLTARDGRFRPMVLDFGVAKEVGAPAEPSGARHPVGTPMYLAPELLADETKAGPATDQYALGVILYEALTGEHPYAADDLPQLFRAIAAGKPPSPRARRPETPVEVDRLVTRAMSADPQARFGTVADLGRALAPFATTPGAAAPTGRRRPPSSPAIALEAATPSPFVRTLIPEADAQSGPWFSAPPSADDLSSAATLPLTLPPRLEPPASAAPRRASALAAKTAIVRDDHEAEPSPRWNRRRIAIVSAVALGGCLLALLLIRGGGSGHHAPRVGAPASLAGARLGAPVGPAAAAPVSVAAAPRPAAAAAPGAVALQPAAAASTRPAVSAADAPRASVAAAPAAPPARPETRAAAAPAIAARPEGRGAAAPAIAARSEGRGAAAPAIAPRPEVRVATAAAPARAATPVAAAISSAAPHASRLTAPPAGAGSSESPAARPPAASRREPPVARATEAGEPGAEPPKRASRARDREGSGVRMHNGVPLLD